MAKTKNPAKPEVVKEYFETLHHPLKEIVEALRSIVLAADGEIGEQIKWNSPSFYYSGEMKPFDPKEYKRDVVVFNLHKNEHVLLVFPTGALVTDDTGVLEGAFTDGRKTAKFETMAQVKKREKDLQSVIKKWLALIDK